jgi:hypothetical protein
LDKAKSAMTGIGAGARNLFAAAVTEVLVGGGCAPLTRWP